jgi:surface polysaccharide O-acyltransferase-like enzyme
MGALFFALFKENIILAAAFAGVTSMNFFLHTFESTVVALPLFLLIGGMLSKKSLHDQK